MNIFYLHKLPIVAAAMHCDKHVVKMALETCQMLSTVHSIHDKNCTVQYAPTHSKHPCVKWAAQSTLQYQWLQSLGAELCNQYSLRYNSRHKCEALIKGELRAAPAALMKHPRIYTPPPQCMPDKYRGEDTVSAYRRYYIGEKSRFAKWDRLGNAPFWWLTSEVVM